MPKNDLLAVTIVLVAVVAELAIREAHYRLSAEIPRLLLVFFAWAVFVSGVWCVCQRFGLAAAQAAGRAALFAALSLWWAVVGTVALTPTWNGGTVSAAMPWAVYGALGLGACWAHCLSARSWAAMRRIAATASFLFVVSQPLVAGMRAQALSWPEPAASAKPVSNDSLMVFLLLDELNAKSAPPLLQALSLSGAPVHFKTLVPVSDATSKVIPAMFTGERFSEAKPCGINTVCSGNRVLDFSKIVASRTDVDVVGFYEPYCAIRGLRYCSRLAQASPAFDFRRWWCAALRRSAWLSSVAGSKSASECAELGGEVWHGLVSDTEQALWQAPVWREGGFLYAHVPLPHPPGEGGGGSLAVHYQNNMARATRLVARVAQHAASQPNRRFTIVLYSDHPLRASVWCASTQYAHNGCPLPPSLVDEHVPLIVAGDLPPAYDTIENNINIFQLAVPSVPSR